MNSNQDQDFLKSKLRALSIMRSELVSCFLEQCQEIYVPIWKYYRHPQAMELSIHKFVLSWLNSHWEKFESILRNNLDCDDQEKCFAEKELLKIYYSLFSKISKNQFSKNNLDVPMIASLLIQCAGENLMCIQKIIDAHENSEKHKTMLKIAIDKHKEIFQQKIDDLISSEQNNK